MQITVCSNTTGAVAAGGVHWRGGHEDEVSIGVADERRWGSPMGGIVEATEETSEGKRDDPAQPPPG